MPMAKYSNTQENRLQRSMARSMDVIYEDIWTAGEIERWTEEHVAFETRGPLALFDLTANIGLSSTARIIDVGCGRGDYACALASRYGSTVVATDPVESNLERARRLVQEQDLAAQVTVQKGEIESLPFADGSFALVWCRSVIVHLPDLVTAFQACHRLLEPGGHMMLQTGYATERMAADELATLCRQLSFYPETLQRPNVETALQQAGFTIMQSAEFSSEHAEFYEQQDGRCAKYLIGIARLLRTEERVVAQFGRAAYETALGMYHWQIYQMLGRISYHAYLLKS